MKKNEDIERLVFLLETIEDMGETLTESESFDSAVRYLLRMMLGSIGVSRGCIFTYQAGSELMRLKANINLTEKFVYSFELSSDIAKRIAENPGPCFIENLPEYLAVNFDEIIKSWQTDNIRVVIPLAVKNELLGVICLGKRFMEQSFSRMDIEVLGLLTRHISLYFHSQKRLEHSRTANFELNRKILELEQLFEVGLAITSLKKLDDLLAEILTRSVAILDASFGVIWMLKDGMYYLAESFGFSTDDKIPSLLQDLNDKTENEMQETDENCIAAPLKVRNEQLGLICVAGKEKRDGGYEKFSDVNIQLLTSLANQAAVAVENSNLLGAAIEKERMDQELRVAAEIQENLLPDSFPENPDLDIYAFTIPCRTVGGDFFDFFYNSEKHSGVVIADVSGKSVPAALLVSSFQGALRAISETTKSLEILASRLNELLVKITPDNKFITASFLVWNPATRQITTLSAGHEPVLLIRKNKEISTIGKGGLILGMIAGASYESEKTQLSPGDILCLYTDGITDRLNPDGERFGDTRLKEIMQKSENLDVSGIVQSVFSELEAFADGEPPPDDQTIILIKCR